MCRCSYSISIRSVAFHHLISYLNLWGFVDYLSNIVRLLYVHVHTAQCVLGQALPGEECFSFLERSLAISFLLKNR